MATRVEREPYPVGKLLVGLLAVALVLFLLTTRFDADFWETFFRRLPYILVGNQSWWPVEGGFAANILISVACMAIATVMGLFVGLAQLSRFRVVAAAAWLFTHFFRNSPWLVILYAMLFLLPFRVDLGFVAFRFPEIAKAVIALSLPVAANVSEIVRGAVQSIPYGQWEAALSFGYSRRQTMRLVILPQATRRMIPPWMNLYAILTMATTLANLVGVDEGLTAVRRLLELEGQRFAIPFYTLLLVLFFAYCYPIARCTAGLERRFAHQG
jgi:polar amino acid transport system permease protein